MFSPCLTAYWERFSGGTISLAWANTKPPFIMEHSGRAVSLLVQTVGGCLAVPLALACRIHESRNWKAERQVTKTPPVALVEDSQAGELPQPRASIAKVLAGVNTPFRRTLSIG